MYSFIRTAPENLVGHIYQRKLYTQSIYNTRFTNVRLRTKTNLQFTVRESELSKYFPTFTVKTIRAYFLLPQYTFFVPGYIVCFMYRNA